MTKKNIVSKEEEARKKQERENTKNKEFLIYGTKLTVYDVVCKLEPKLKQMFIQEGKSNPQFDAHKEFTIYIWASRVLEYFFAPDMTRTDAALLYEGIRRNRKKIKLRMATQFCDNLFLNEIDSSKFPIKSATKYVKKNGIKNFESKENKKITAYLEESSYSMSAWADNIDSNFYECPFFGEYTPAKRKDFLERDLQIAIYQYITKNCNNSKEEFKRSYFLELEKGYFSSSRNRFDIVDYESNFITDIPLSPCVGNDKRMSLTINKEYFRSINNGRVTSLDAKDQDILCGLVQKCSNSSSKELIIPVAEIASFFSSSPNQLSKRDYEEAEKRCYKLVNYTYNKFDNDRLVGAMNFLQYAIFSENEKLENENKVKKTGYMRIRLSNIIEEAIENSKNVIKNSKIKQLPAPAYRKLKNETAKLLYLYLQRLRITQHQLVQKGIVDSYAKRLTYDDFAKVIYFCKVRDKMNIDYNFERIMDALNEYVNNEVILKRADREERDNPRIRRKINAVEVEFYELIEEEVEDLKAFGWGDDDDLYLEE